MLKIGRKLYYDNRTGAALVDTGERIGDVRDTTREEDFSSFRALSELNPETVGMIQLQYGQYEQDFAEAIAWSVNLETLTPVFSYPDPNNPEPTEPVYQAPLTEQVKKIQEENILLKAQNSALSDRADFIEDVIAEMAQQVYQ